MKRNEFFYYIAKNFGDDYYFGSHGTDNTDALEKIKEEGLMTKTPGNVYRTAGTVTSMGIIITPEDIYDIMDYSYGCRNSVICAFPIMLENGKESIFMGYSGKTPNCYPKDQEDYKCLMTDLCDILGYVPPEFILAYKTNAKQQPGDEEFEINEGHYSQLNSEQRICFFNRIIEQIKEKPNNQTLLKDLENFSDSKILKYVLGIDLAYKKMEERFGKTERPRMIVLAKEKIMSNEKRKSSGEKSESLSNGIDEDFIDYREKIIKDLINLKEKAIEDKDKPEILLDGLTKSLDDIAIKQKQRDLKRLMKGIELEYKKDKSSEKENILYDRPV